MRLQEFVEELPGGISTLCARTADEQGRVMAWTTVASIVRGEVAPRFENAQRLSKATGGKVTVPEIFAAFDPKLADVKRRKERAMRERRDARKVASRKRSRAGARLEARR